MDVKIINYLIVGKPKSQDDPRRWNISRFPKDFAESELSFYRGEFPDASFELREVASMPAGMLEELLKDKARLDKIESSATYIEIDGDDYYIGNNNFDTIREFIESKMKGEG